MAGFISPVFDIINRGINVNNKDFYKKHTTYIKVHSNMNKLSENILFNLPITSSPEENILEYVMETLLKTDKKVSIYTPNPEIIVKTTKSNAYREVLQQGSILLPDGSGLIISSWILARPLLYRVTGVDFMVKLVQKVNAQNEGKPIRIGFLGGKRNVALKTAQCLLFSFPNLTVSFLGEEWETGVWIPDSLSNQLSEKQFGNMEDVENAIAETSSGNKSIKKELDILFVAFGAPKQEEWIHANLPTLPIQVAMGVGGSFDFLSGEVKRAPFLLRFMGLEWLYRLIKQPWRWKRQVALLSFIKLVCVTWVVELRTLFHKKSDQ